MLTITNFFHQIKGMAYNSCNSFILVQSKVFCNFGNFRFHSNTHLLLILQTIQTALIFDNAFEFFPFVFLLFFFKIGTILKNVTLHI